MCCISTFCTDVYVCVCVFILGATAAGNHPVPLLRTGLCWGRCGWHKHKFHFSRGRSAEDQPGAGEAASERRQRRGHSVRLLGLPVCQWNDGEKAPDPPRLGERLLWWSPSATQAEQRPSRQPGRIPCCQFAKLCPFTFSTHTEDPWGAWNAF